MGFGAYILYGALALVVVVVVWYLALRPKQPFRTDRCQTLTLRDGRALGYAIHGITDVSAAKRVVVYFHGLCGSRLEVVDIDECADLVRRGIAFVGVDRPGIGLSTYAPNRTVKDWAFDVEQLLTHLRVDRVSVMGFSSGCPYVHACVQHLGRRVLSATCVGGQGPFYAYQTKAGASERDALRGFKKAYKPLLALNYAMSQPLLRPLAKLYYAHVTFAFFRNPKAATAAFWGGKLYNSHAHTKAMLQRNNRAAFSAPYAVEALVQDLSLPNTPWGFDLSQCAGDAGSGGVRYFIHHGKADKMRPIHESIYVATHLTAANVSTNWHDATGHTLHLFADKWALLLDEIMSVPMP